MAHKKAAGSSKNLKDSNSKYRGVKLFGGQTAKAGNIIIRQKGDKYHLGDNVYKGRDFTIHAAIDGVVTFSKTNVTKYNGRVYLKTVVNVVPADQKPVVKAEKVVAKKAETTEKKAVAKKAEKVETTEKKVAAKKPAAPKATAAKKPAVKKAAKAQTPAKKKAE